MKEIQVILPEEMIQDGFFEENGCLKHKEGACGMEAVRIPDGIISVDSRCFADAAELKEVVIPRGVKELGVAAFSGCQKLEKAVLPDGLTRIRKELFTNCTSLRELVIPKTVRDIGEWAFRGCRNLEKLVIPPEVEEICAEVCVDCPKVVIYGKENSCAHKFAETFGIQFQAC